MKTDDSVCRALRLALDTRTRSRAMSLAPGPVEYDRMHANHDVRVFRTPSARPRPDRRVLGTEPSERARAFFLVGPRPAPRHQGTATRRRAAAAGSPRTARRANLTET